MIPVFIISGVLLLAPIYAALPDDPLWSPFLFALILIASGIALLLPGRAGHATPLSVRRPLALMGLFVGLAALSIAVQWLGVHHGRPVYMDAMLRQGGAYLAFVALAAALSRLNSARLPAFTIIVGLLLGAAIASAIGLQDYLAHVRAHIADWREFATSTPDYFAALLVTTIPITVALVVGCFSNESKIGAALYLIALLIQLLVLFATGSRFALIALTAGIVTLAWGLVVAAKTGGAMPKLDKRAVAAIAVILVLGGAVGAKTIAHRLFGKSAQAQNNSAMFRWWTWKGCERTALDNPLLGTGPGTFVYSYQRYAYIGFTRAAHNSYFQATAETGFPAGVVLTLGLLATFGAGFRAIRQWPVAPAIAEQGENDAPSDKRAPQTAAAAQVTQKGGEQSRRPPPAGQKATKSANASTETAGAKGRISEQILAIFGVVDERILIAGLAAAFLAGLVQNLIDSDWYVTFDGLVLWSVGGLLLGYARRAHDAGAPVGRSDQAESSARLVPAILTAALYVVAAIGFVAAGVAQIDAIGGDTALATGDVGTALSGFQSAISINAVRGSYFSKLGMSIYPRMGDVPNSETALKQAAAIEPDATNYRRLGKFYLAHNRPADALKQFQAGIDIGWNDLDLYLLSAQAHTALGDTLGALDDDRVLAAMQTAKIGLYPAIGDIVEIRFAQADIPLGDDAIAHHNYAEAIHYYTRGLPIVEKYIDEGGTMNAMRQQTAGGTPDPDADSQMLTMYTGAMNGLIEAYEESGQPSQAAAAKVEETAGITKLNSIIADDTNAVGAPS